LLHHSLLHAHCHVIHKNALPKLLLRHWLSCHNWLPSYNLLLNRHLALHSAHDLLLWNHGLSVNLVTLKDVDITRVIKLVKDDIHVVFSKTLSFKEILHLKYIHSHILGLVQQLLFLH
jgi:hypothetical protein